MPAKKLRELSDLTPDPGNANAGTERGAIQVENSLREYGAGRSIVTDKNGVVIAGNKTLESAADIGLPIEVVQTDGTKLVVVQRTDLELDNGDPKARLLAYADNRASEVGLEWDVGQITMDLEAGVDLGSLFQDFEIEAMVIERNPDVGSACASPWERQGQDGAEGIMFSFGEIVRRLPEDVYKVFLSRCPENTIEEYLIELFS